MMVPGRLATLLVGFFIVLPALAQTPSPLAAWQDSAGVVLRSLDDTPLPEWSSTMGGGIDIQPSFTGSKGYHILPSLALDVRYDGIAFASLGEGIGVNLLSGSGFRAGVAVGYDLGRDSHDDPRLTHLPNIAFAPEPKIFAQYFWKPVVLTLDLRKGIGGNDGIIGDVGAYVPLPLGERTFLFVGPTVTLADQRYMTAYFGVSPATSRAAGFAAFAANGGFRDAGAGASVVHLFGDHWMIEADTAGRRLLGDAAHSPITETRLQVSADVNVAYRF